MRISEKLISYVFVCEMEDFSILNNVGYNVCSIFDYLASNSGDTPTLSEIMDEVFAKGLRDLRSYIVQRLIELRRRSEQDKGLSDSEIKKIEDEMTDLKKLYPFDDIHYISDGLNTRIYFERNKEIYKKYLVHEITRIEDLMGTK